MLLPVQWKHWIQADILRIDQICNPTESRVLGQQELVEKFGITCNFLQALTLRMSIPHAWKTQLTGNYKGNISHIFGMEINKKCFDILSSNPRRWYEEIVRRQAPPFNRDKGWVRDLDLSDQGCVAP